MVSYNEYYEISYDGHMTRYLKSYKLIYVRSVLIFDGTSTKWKEFKIVVYCTMPGRDEEQ